MSIKLKENKRMDILEAEGMKKHLTIVPVRPRHFKKRKGKKKGGKINRKI